jgi:hypothetical protein
MYYGRKTNVYFHNFNLIILIVNCTTTLYAIMSKTNNIVYHLLFHFLQILNGLAYIFSQKKDLSFSAIFEKVEFANCEIKPRSAGTGGSTAGR